VLREIDFLLKFCRYILCLSHMWRVVTDIEMLKYKLVSLWRTCIYQCTGDRHRQNL